MSELLPCPHCSSTDVHIDGVKGSLWWVWCDGCSAHSGDFGTEQYAIAAWNRRSTPASSPMVEDRNSLFAVYAHNVELDMTVRIPGYCGTMEEVRRGVMEKAQREGFKGDFVERMAELGWWLEPLVLKNGQAIARQRGEEAK